MTNEPVIIERTFNAPAETVWKAITNKDQMRQWYFDVSDFKPETGFEFRFEGGNEEQSLCAHMSGYGSGTGQKTAVQLAVRGICR
jgi:uncharacterized protein YndB with AHSA1/START domain